MWRIKEDTTANDLNVLSIIGQLKMGILIDHFGLFGTVIRPVNFSRVATVGLLIAVGYLMVR
ncbi:MAG: DMT family transporter [Chloroflexi bacterium]|nr:DMT family transporter [Chloroflexota bacterium]